VVEEGTAVEVWPGELRMVEATCCLVVRQVGLTVVEVNSVLEVW
jgi:hypothetical protein